MNWRREFLEVRGIRYEGVGTGVNRAAAGVAFATQREKYLLWMKRCKLTSRGRQSSGKQSAPKM